MQGLRMKRSRHSVEGWQAAVMRGMPTRLQRQPTAKRQSQVRANRLPAHSCPHSWCRGCHLIEEGAHTTSHPALFVRRAWPCFLPTCSYVFALPVLSVLLFAVPVAMQLLPS